MISIPRNMTNEESKLYAKIVANEIQRSIAEANINAAKRRLGLKI